MTREDLKEKLLEKYVDNFYRIEEDINNGFSMINPKDIEKESVREALDDCSDEIKEFCEGLLKEGNNA